MLLLIPALMQQLTVAVIVLPKSSAPVSTVAIRPGRPQQCNSSAILSSEPDSYQPLPYFSISLIMILNLYFTFWSSINASLNVAWTVISSPALTVSSVPLDSKHSSWNCRCCNISHKSNHLFIWCIPIFISNCNTNIVISIIR